MIPQVRQMCGRELHFPSIAVPLADDVAGLPVADLVEATAHVDGHVRAGGFKSTTLVERPLMLRRAELLTGRTAGSMTRSCRSASRHSRGNDARRQARGWRADACDSPLAQRTADTVVRTAIRASGLCHDTPWGESAPGGRTCGSSSVASLRGHAPVKCAVSTGEMTSASTS